MLGLVAEFSGTPAVIDECTKIVPGWEAVGQSEESQSSVQGEIQGEQSTWEKILGYLGAGIDAICQYKDQLISFLGGKYRRYMRLFLQGRIHGRMRWRLAGFFGNVWNGIKKAGSAVVSGVKKAGAWVADKASQAWNWVKEQAMKLVQPILNLIESIKQKVMNFIQNNPILKKAYDFFQCFMNNQGMEGAQNIVNKVKAIIAMLGTLTTPIGWVKLIANLVCNWRIIKEGIDYLKAALREGNRLVKYNLFGKMTGKFLTAFAS
jgi:hypothetical protein